jgi:nitrogen fixation protein FixH
LDITVNVTDVNEAPAFTSNATFSAAENQTAIGTVAVSDVDGDTISYSISGSDITINSSSGVIAFASAPNYETKSSYTATVSVTDGTNTTTQAVTINITDVNDAPIINSYFPSTFTVAENGGQSSSVLSTTCSNRIVVILVCQPNGTVNIGGGNVVEAFEDEDDELGVSGNLRLTFSGTDASFFGATPLGEIYFDNGSPYVAPDYETKSSYSANVVLSDGTDSVTQAFVLNITNVNDVAPVFTSEATFSVAATDADGDTIAYSVSGTDSGSVSINSSTGVLTFNSAPNYESKTSYSIVVTASDGTNSTTQNIIINITDILENSEPIIINLKPQIELQEEDKKFLYTVEATDADGDTIYFQLTGADANKFTLSSSGDLAFKEIPDYENPTDADTDNIYEINVLVSDIQSSSTSIMPAGKSDQIETNTSNNTEVRVTNFDEDIIGLTLTSIDGNDSTGPQIRLQLVIDSYTDPNSIRVLYQGPNAGQYWTGAGSPTTDNFKMTYDHTFTAPDSSPSGQWRIRTIRMQTDQGQIEHKQDFLINKGFTTTTDVYNPNSDTNKPQLESISEPVVQGNDSNPDTSIIISFEITASDQENAYNRGHSRWESPASEGGWPYKGGWGITDLSQNPPKTTFTASLDPKTVSGIYKFEDIRLYDKAGNRKMYYCVDYGDEGYKLRTEDYEIFEGAVCTVNIDNPIEDNTKPQLTKFVLSGSTNAEGRKIISHEYEVDNKTSWTDQETGLRRIYLRMSGPISYDIYDSNLPFKGDTLLPLDAPAGTYQVNYFFVTDNALNDNKYYKNEMDELGFTTSVTFD